MAMEPTPLLAGVTALAKAVHRGPMALAKCTDTDICTWSIDARAYDHIEVPDMLIGVLTQGDVRWTTKADSRTGCLRRGRIAIIPAATGVKMRPISPLLATTIHVSPERTNRTFGIDYGSALLERANLRLGLNNAFMAGSLLAIDNEIRKPTQHGSIFIDSVITALLHQVLFFGDQAIKSNGSTTLNKYKLNIVYDYVESHIDSAISLEKLASLVNLSQFHFCKSFKSATGTTPHKFVIKCRIKKAKDLLERTDKNITDIALAVGLSSHSHLSSSFRQIEGVSPSDYRKRTRC